MTTKHIGYLMSDITRLMRKRFNDDPRLSSCLTLAQAKALIYTHNHEGIRQVELAELMEITPMTVVRLIDSLVNESLLERRADEHDRRAYLLYVTPKGLEVVNKVRSISQELWGEALQGVKEEEVAQVIDVLMRINRNLIEK